MDSSRMLALFSYYACIRQHSLTYLSVLMGRNRGVLGRTSRNFSKEDQAKGDLLQGFPNTAGRQLCSHPSENGLSSSVKQNTSTSEGSSEAVHVTFHRKHLHMHAILEAEWDSERDLVIPLNQYCQPLLNCLKKYWNPFDSEAANFDTLY